jgi:hypothetical protein
MKIRKIREPKGKGNIPLNVIKKAIKKMSEKRKDDAVDHPRHYQGNKLEVIDIIEDFDLGFCLGNAIKYILRAGKKIDLAHSRDLDLKKAMWYITRAIEKEKE